MLTYADIELDSVAHKVVRGGQIVAMGPTEFRLLRHFMEHPGRVLSRGQLLDSVWGQDSDIELRTVDVHIRRLRQAITCPAPRQQTAPCARRGTRPTRGREPRGP